MKKSSDSRRRVVLMGCGTALLSGIGTPIAIIVPRLLHVPVVYAVLPLVAVESLAIAFTVKALGQLKAEEAL